MKLIIKDYLASLKEREELDAILPDLLSELGFTVFSRPQRGTVQHGVDIAAVGIDEVDNQRKVFLFSIKPGDLTRQDWASDKPQALRPSLEDIMDAYIATRIPRRYSKLKVVICICIGGDIQEQARPSVKGFQDRHTNKRISFDEWNGDKIAELILRGTLREKVLPAQMRTSFRKAIAMVDEPDVSYHHFADLLANIRTAASAGPTAGVRAIRQINICVWILFVWARDAGNLEAAYRASELALLSGWDILKPTLSTTRKGSRALSTGVHQLVDVHLRIAGHFLNKVMRHARVRHGISASVRSGSALDVNRKVFELLGRFALTELWLAKLKSNADGSATEESKARMREACKLGVSLIGNNPNLLLPICDDQTIDLALFLQLWIFSELGGDGIAPWLIEIVDRLDFSIRTRSRYPAVFAQYRELSSHPRERTDQYFQEATAGSTLIPVLAVWAVALNLRQPYEKLVRLQKDKLGHCNMQTWMPDQASERSLYTGEGNHGRALSDIPLQSGPAELVSTIKEACESDDSFAALTANATGFWPIVLAACRHHRFPVPPQFWIDALTPESPRDWSAADGGTTVTQE